jgi:transglutaminase-like putative cysteine protease
MGRARRLLLALVALTASAGLFVGTAGADLALHEFIPPDPAEDLALRATTRDGRLPAAVDTPSGIMPAPPERRQAPETAYGGNATPDSIDASYRIDGDTTRPEVVSYDDPFVPTVTPFKRLYAYDTVDEGTELVVSDRRLRKVEMGGVPLPGEDQFFGDLFVDAAPGVPVRIPTPGPGARILASRIEPSASVEIVRDGADNWFLVGSSRQRLRLVLELAVPRASFGAPFPDVSWASLVPRVPLLPPSVREVAREVLRSLGLSQSVNPRDALASLVTYFRSFAPSDDLPRARLPVDLYKELALSKKGVCRHRAFAFTISALALGLPARLVRNEAHAWVEVSDGAIWHRIDLGGAAGRFELDPSAQAQPHVPPEDPYVWPAGSQNTALSVGSSSSAPSAGSAAAPASAAPQKSSGSAPEPTESEASEAAASATPNASSGRAASTVELTVARNEARRGARLAVSGAVVADGDACPTARVDVALQQRSGKSFALGSVPTDASGHFSAELTVPLGLEVGDYTLLATTPGAGLCGPSAAPRE